MTIARKMQIIFVAVLLGLIMLAGMSQVQTGKVFEAANYANINTVPSLDELTNAVNALTTIRVSVWQHVAQTDPAEMARLEKKIVENTVTVEESLKKYEKEDLSNDKDKLLLAVDRDSLAKYVAIRDQVLALSRQGKKTEARDLLMANQKILTEVGKAFDGHIDFNIEQGRSMAKEALGIKRSAMFLSLAGTLLIALVVGGICLTVSRAVLRQINYAVEITKAVAAGDLSREVRSDSKDEVGMILGALAEMVGNLRQMVSQIIDISGSVATASGQLRSTSDQIATGAEETVAQSNTVATASEEMAATSGDIARNCTVAAEASARSAQAAQAGAAIVEETIVGMGVIAERVRATSVSIEALGTRSDQIGAIVGTIEDIADQTNLLALNAAIEAARAGDQGRGFAVVADEVRALAERTTKATREIGEMIRAIQGETRTAVCTMEEGVLEVEKGAAASSRSEEALEMILNSINEVSLQVSQIATAAEEQTATTGEVTSNILQISEVVQETARGAEETAASAGTLAAQAQDLKQLVSRFRL
ncbi:methyl-accepting chemotaxis protein [Geomonas limicola]|uniref:Methyl-accepting chemotaxis protein n=1 Tax=Geomonas limicola TaxID=2740186 RepID=A0A6V8N703_9BACT|nr:HAMP domain-containing methyl-accepting chemotaxis protein [Geomonas limicola]GFO67059.1 methyl-accepting chemotaxis protein [Geomonas limicola]